MSEYKRKCVKAFTLESFDDDSGKYFNWTFFFFKMKSFGKFWRALYRKDQAKAFKKLCWQHFKTSGKLFIPKMWPTHHFFSFKAFHKCFRAFVGISSKSKASKICFFPCLISLLRVFFSISAQISNETFSLLKRNVQALKLIFGVCEFSFKVLLSVGDAGRLD